MKDIIKRLGALALIPVVTIEKLEDALPLANALCKGGLPVAEVTFRTTCAKDAIAEIVKAYPQMLVGAGTVLTNKQVDDAIEAGAQFVVSPGLNPEVVKYAIDKGILIIPGCANPSDIEIALSLGLNFVKFFPAEAAGGLPMIKAMGAPYTSVKFMPTGGINETNIGQYLQYNKILACGGSWMVDKEMISQRQFDKIKKATQKAVQTMLGLTFEHVNKLKIEDRNSEQSVVDYVLAKEINWIDEMPQGSNEYVTYSTPYLDRVINYLSAVGVVFDEASKRYNEKGKCIAILTRPSKQEMCIELIQQ